MKTILLHVYQQVTRSYHQFHCSGHLCSMLTYDLLYVAPSRACSTPKRSIFVHKQSDAQRGLPRSHAELQKGISCFLIFIFIGNGRYFDIYCTIYLTGQTGNPRYLLLRNHQNELFIQNCVMAIYNNRTLCTCLSSTSLCFVTRCI